MTDLKQKMAKRKNTKLDLIWIIPEWIGVIGILISACVYLSRNIDMLHTDLWLGIFHLALVMIVIGEGFKWLGHAGEELKKVLR